ncbi:MAG: rRNA maturation RNase YbeY [Acidobacteria bacterium]|nr:rRNA maturation RNase YbeY [Acidobacteriota bacterium]
MGPSSKKYLVINKQRKHAVDRAKLNRFISTLVSDLGLEDREFSVVFVTDERIRRYNRDYRGFDKATDVLSFQGGEACLGDILISSETAYNQARQSSTLTFDASVRRLILHGLLHLMGYDHETDDGKMRSIERRLRRRFRC